MNEVIWSYGEEKPEPVVVMRLYGQNVSTINIMIERYEDGGYKWLSLQLPAAVWDYDSIVDKIITLYYPNDKMQAVINNYLLDPNDADALEEFNAMQEWRAAAKDYAHQLMDYAEENNL